MTGPRVRPARRDDLPGILERWAELMALHAELDPSLYSVGAHGPGSYRAFLRKHLDDGILLVAEAEGGRIAGYLLACVGQRAPVYVERDIGIIIDVAVAPDERGQGIGCALVDEVLSRFRQDGVLLIQVNYAVRNLPAVEFWQRRGFEPSLVEAYLRLD